MRTADAGLDFNSLAVVEGLGSCVGEGKGDAGSGFYAGIGGVELQGELFAVLGEDCGLDYAAL